MRFITESSLLILLLCCCCCLTVNAKCWIECPVSQRGLSEPECFLKDDGASTSCSKSIQNTDLTSQSITKYKFVSISIDLSPKVSNLYIYNYLGSNLKVGAFRSHPNVTYLRIWHNRVYIRPRLFYLFPNLRYLHLHQVKLRYFPHFSYSNPRLTYLKIRYVSFAFPGSYNSILRRGRVSDLSQLSHLELYFNQFFNATDETFSGLTVLNTLYLQRIHIPNPVATFSPLVRLNRLYYYYSDLTDISFLKQTSSLFRLKYLSFYNNRITSIQNNTFSHYTNLNDINFNNNKISRLENDCFKGLGRVRNLRLYSNRLRELSATAFKGLDSLYWMNLGYNSISRLSSRTFEYLNRLRYVYLSSLPLHCGCYLQWMSKVSITFYYSRCTTPPQHSGKQATDASIYVNCTQELSYQCFTRSVRCPTGSYCQDTLDSYTCVCKEEKYYFVKPLNQCIAYDKLKCART